MELTEESVICLIAKYYDDDGFMHALRVARYVEENPLIPEKYKDNCLYLAMMHDLLEDTSFKDDYPACGLPEDLQKALELISKPKDMNYIDYIKMIHETEGTEWKEWVYWVKLMDMKDHFAQTETLTDKLKNKYVAALPYLL